MAKSERQSVEKLIGAVPDVTVWANVERRLKTFSKNLTYAAVHPISRYQQVAARSHTVAVVDFSAKVDFHSQVFGASLQNLQQTQTLHSGKTVSVDRYFTVAIDYVDVVPGFKCSGDLGV